MAQQVEASMFIYRLHFLQSTCGSRLHSRDGERKREHNLNSVEHALLAVYEQHIRTKIHHSSECDGVIPFCLCCMIDRNFNFLLLLCSKLDHICIEFVCANFQVSHSNLLAPMSIRCSQSAVQCSAVQLDKQSEDVCVGVCVCVSEVKSVNNQKSRQARHGYIPLTVDSVCMCVCDSHWEELLINVYLSFCFALLLAAMRPILPQYIHIHTRYI